MAAAKTTPEPVTIAAPGLLLRKVFVAESDKLNGCKGDESTMAFTVPWQIMGLQVSGDVGDETIYTDRFGKKIAFPKAPPEKPPTNLQILQRTAFKNAQARWMQLTAPEKKNLEDACRKLSIPITGQNLYMHTIMKLDFSAYATVQRQSGINLPTLP